MAKTNKLAKLGMVDVSAKETTKRLAVAVSEIRMNQKAFAALERNQSPKGDVLEVAKVAGIMAAKSTPAIIPLCHPLELRKAQITFGLSKALQTVRIRAQIAYEGKTGVEMEALTAVSVAALTIYDMLKWADKAMVIGETKLMHKSGGKSGDFNRSS